MDAEQRPTVKFLTWPVAATTLLAVVAGCAPAAAQSAGPVSSVAVPESVTPSAAVVRPTSPAADASPGSPERVSRDRALVRPVSGARLSIPSIGVRDLRVVGHAGRADNLAGTRIQDRGLAASPRDRSGGTSPGEVGNLLITAHRTSAGGPFRRLPDLPDGAHILISSGGKVYDYVVTATMTISFRSKASLARQSAAVPGHPGRPATRPMITLSTCATPEDHARGNYWADALGNPEHRIDKVGVLAAVRDG